MLFFTFISGGMMNHKMFFLKASLINIILLLITIFPPTVDCVDFWPARAGPSSGWRMAPALWANIAATLGTMWMERCCDTLDSLDTMWSNNHCC